MEVFASLIEIELHMRTITGGKCEPYDAGVEIWKIAMSEVESSPDIMHPFWLIWGSLTDWVEIRPAEKIEAENAMVRASSEWLNLDHRNPVAIKAYCDRYTMKWGIRNLDSEFDKLDHT